MFSFGERWNVLFNSAIASLNRTFHPSPHENIPTITLINIHYLYNIVLNPVKENHLSIGTPLGLEKPGFSVVVGMRQSPTVYARICVVFICGKQ